MVTPTHQPQGEVAVTYGPWWKPWELGYFMPAGIVARFMYTYWLLEVTR
jgi:hypothetical protein